MGNRTYVFDVEVYIGPVYTIEVEADSESEARGEAERIASEITEDAFGDGDINYDVFLDAVHVEA